MTKPTPDSMTAKTSRAPKVRTAADVKAELHLRGITIKQWAEKHGYPYQAVSRVLTGVSKCTYGMGHDIAVDLGMKSAPAAE